ncbi:MAG: hypothetical protein R3D70_10695 [Rhizobiaceae bacterium]
MGFVSKLEDENERREEASPLPRSQRLTDFLSQFGPVPSLPRKNPLDNLNAVQVARFEGIIRGLEKAKERKAKATDSNQLMGFLKAHAAYAKQLEALIQFLVPFVLGMKGEERVFWANALKRLRNAKSL